MKPNKAISRTHPGFADSYFALNMSASPYERFSTFVQTLWRTFEGGLEMELDYALAEWEAHDFLKRREASLGLNYWFSPNFVLKLSYYPVSGHLFRPERPSSGKTVRRGRPRPRPGEPRAIGYVSGDTEQEGVTPPPSGTKPVLPGCPE